MNSYILLKPLSNYKAIYKSLDNLKNNNNKMFQFNINIKNISNNPYIYNINFPKNITYNLFTLNINKLLKNKIESSEIKYLYNNYGICTIKKNIKLINIIDKYYETEETIYNDILNILIINKRLEFLLDYVKQKKFNIEYINYIKLTLITLKKNTKFIIKLLEIN